LSIGKKITLVIIYTLLVTITVVGGFKLGQFIAHPFESSATIDMEEVEETNGRVKVNLLVVGVDKTEGLSDVIMVVRYDEEENMLCAMSIPRDTYVNYKGGTRLVNSVYGLGGIKGVSKVVTELTGLSINYYVQFNVGTFAELVDLLGGVEFNVPQNMNYDDPVQDLHIHLKKGQQTLDGENAESMVRFRGYPEADLMRVKVQQNLLKALIKQKLNTEMLTKIPTIYSNIKDDIECNMPLTDMAIYGKSMLKLTSSSIKTFTMPTMFTGVDAHLYQDRTATDKLMEKEFKTEGPIIGNASYEDNED